MILVLLVSEKLGKFGHGHGFADEVTLHFITALCSEIGFLTFSFNSLGNNPEL